MGNLLPEPSAPRWRLGTGRLLRLDLLCRAGLLWSFQPQTDVALRRARHYSNAAGTPVGPRRAAPASGGACQARIREGPANRHDGDGWRQAEKGDPGRDAA